MLCRILSKGRRCRRCPTLQSPNRLDHFVVVPVSHRCRTSLFRTFGETFGFPYLLRADLQSYAFDQPERTIFARLREATLSTHPTSSQSQAHVQGQRQERVNHFLKEIDLVSTIPTAKEDAFGSSTPELRASFSSHDYGANMTLQSTSVPFKLSLDRLPPLQSARLLRTQLLLPLMGFVAVAEKHLGNSSKGFFESVCNPPTPCPLRLLLIASSQDMRENARLVRYASLLSQHTTTQ